MAEVKAHQSLYAYLNAAWVDISDDFVLTASAEWGIGSEKHTDRVARVGSFTFYLNNISTIGKYSPDHPNVLNGWKKGVFIKHVITYDGVSYVRFRGFVDTIKNYGSRDEYKQVTCLDWMEYAARNPINNPGFLENMTGDEVLDETLALMQIQPQATDFDTGINVFETAFDTITSKTKAMSEFVKVANSELGYVYLRKDQVNGETLVFENAKARNGLRTPTEYISEATTSFLLKEDGGFLLQEDNGKIILNQLPVSITLHLDDDPSVMRYDIEDGENIINRMTVYAVPRRFDTSNQILFQLDAPVPIASGQTIIIKGTYANPDGGLPINANPDDMVSPVATTDYRAFINSDGTGTEFTASLTVTPSYGTNGFSHTVYNGAGRSGFITLFNCRGKGIYTYNPIEKEVNSTASQNNYGIISDSLTQKYKNNLVLGGIFSDWVVDEEKDPRTIVKKVYLNANKNVDKMNAFLQLDVGDLIHITESKSNIDGYYFIQGVSYQTSPGGLIMFQYIVKPFLSLALGLSQIAYEGYKDTSSAINFGYIQELDTSKLTSMTFSAWVYPSSPVGSPPSFEPYIFYYYAYDSSYFWIQVSWTGANRHLIFSAKGKDYGITANKLGVLPQNQWSHIAITYTYGDAQPIFYVNGVSQTLSFSSGSAGIGGGDKPGQLIIGNQYDYTNQYNSAFGGRIKDARIYNRILSGAEITILYNGGVPNMDLVTSGLQFQAFVVPTNRLSQYIDQSLTSAMKVRDRINGVIGTPNGTITGRTP